MPNVAALRTLVSTRYLRAIALAIVLAGCDDGSNPDLHIARVEVNLAPTLLVGTNASAIARAFDLSGDEVTGVTPRWRSSAPDVVSVDRNGILTAHIVGTANITATMGGISGSAPVAVVPIPVSSIAITPGGGPIDRGQSLQLHAIVTDQFGTPVTDRPVTWKSSFPGIAQVTSGGLVIAIAAGTTDITAASEGVSTSVPITVVVSPVASGPSIESVTPAVLMPGITATIRGTNFGGTPAQNDVRIAGVPAAVLSASATELTVQLGVSGYGCEPTRQVFVQVARGSAADAQQQILQSAPQKNLAVGESTVFTSLADAQCFELSATGGRYVISVFNTTTNAQAGSETSFRLRGARGMIPPGVAAAPPIGASLPAPAPATVASAANLRSVFSESRLRSQEDAHARLLDANVKRINFASLRSPGIAPAPGATANVTASQAVGSNVAMKIPDVGGFLSANQDYCTNNFAVTARVVYNGTRSIVLEDVTAPFAGTMDTTFAKIGKEFDDVMYDLDRNNFGDPLRMDDVLDNNGKIIMLFSPRINTFSGIVGFVVTCDFETTQTAPSSNHAEVFYAGVPTDFGNDTTNERTRTGFYRTIRSTVVHEVKHIASFANRIRDFGKTLDESWVEEGTARIAEEIWSRSAAYDNMTQRSNATYANTVFCDFRPSSPTAPQCIGKPFAALRHFRDYYGFLRDPETHSPLGPKVGIPDGTWYGSAWSLLRWSADMSPLDEASFFSALVRSPLTGVNNLVSRTGRPWEEMQGEWSLAQYVDDLPGFSPVNPHLAFPSWNLRSIFAGMNADSPTQFTVAFPLVPHPVSFGVFAYPVESVTGGGFSLFELSGSQTGRQLIQLQGAGGGDPSQKLRIAVVRIN